jgi:excisionase family DNA binding protein
MLLLSIPAVMEETSLGRTKVYDLIREGRLRAVKVDRRTLVPASALQDFVESLTDVQALETYVDGLREANGGDQ